MKTILSTFAPILSAALLIPSHGFCGGLFSPLGLENAAVMPKGIKSVRLGGFSTELRDKYDGFGNSVPLGNSFNKSITWRELIDTTPAGFERDHFKGGLKALNVNLDGVAGVTRGMVNSRITGTVPVLAMGLTDRLTVGLGVPVLYTNISVSSGWKANQDFQNKLREAQGAGFDNKVQGYSGQLQNVVTTKLASYGYKPLTSEERTDLGDIVLALKYLVYQDGPTAFAIAPRIILPTGRVADVDQVVNAASGDGQWDFGLGAILDHALTSRLTLTSGVNFTYQMASTKAVRVPLSADDSISPDVDRDVREKLGDLYAGILGARYQLGDLWTVGANYSLQYKPKDTYEGGRYESARYGYISNDTNQTMQAGVIALGYSTVPLYRKKQFALPLDASIGFASVFSGTNVGRATLTTLDLTGYF